MFLTPRQTFQKLNKQDVAALAVILSEPWFQRCLVATVAEMSSNLSVRYSDGIMAGNAMFGANMFLNNLALLTVEDSPSKTPADPKLESYDAQHLEAIRKQAMKDLQQPVKQT